ncbi:predicted protein [Aspergillus terreus NIH2624]|uniref:Major facilitator superfamily (MFS) profile domain-containing protein n=1 Tax=Aspergillus terreus (strain NIH 2624 / FGSC A1156) TaxID=341663 RepID=Q0CXX7_ASPTN|nr:uncharacterized protein ATEG_01457 [Aspergillus terreus NIH2624]EAU38214.1 predicted protein [Aspergillus terreus NIH2624]
MAPSIASSRSRSDETIHPSHVASFELEQPPLLPADRGRAAWLMLASCCLIQLPVWGFSLVFGIFQEYLMTHDVLKGSKGGLAVGLLYLLSPISFTLLTRYPHFQKYCAPVGLFLSVCGSLLSSFSQSVWHLILTQGVLCAIGNGLVFSPTTLYLDQWFIQRKGLAYGIMWAAKSICGVALPFVASACLATLDACGAAVRQAQSPTVSFNLGEANRPDLPEAGHFLDAAAGEYHPGIWLLPAQYVPAVLLDLCGRAVPHHRNASGGALQRDLGGGWHCFGVAL